MFGPRVMFPDIQPMLGSKPETIHSQLLINALTVKVATLVICVTAQPRISLALRRRAISSSCASTSKVRFGDTFFLVVALGFLANV
jgi:hypothetical protein